MSLWIDRTYVTLLGAYLDGFERVDENTWRFRCPICGDSKRNRGKKRGYIYRTEGYRFHCHNCTSSAPFRTFLRERNEQLYSDYLIDCLNESGRHQKVPEPTFANAAPEFDTDPLGGLQRLSDLPDDHPARLYLDPRLIPRGRYADMYFTEDFFGFTNSLLPGKFDNLSPSHRIILPLRTPLGRMFGYQGRAIHQVDPRMRYISIMLDKSMPKVFGMERIGPEGDVYVTEGPFDSMFFDQGLASAGGKISADLLACGIDKSRFVVLYDNEPRNKDVVRNIGNAIDHGFRVFLWPRSIKEKDVNEYFCSHPQSLLELRSFVSSNTHSGLMARTIFNEWKKVGSHNHHQR